jgi:hypothetical protein
MINITWLDDPLDKDYEAAEAFLEREYSKNTSEDIIKQLKDVKIISLSAKDVLDMGPMKPLPPDNPRVAKALKRMRKDKPLSPLIAVLFKQGLIMLDGHHRLSAIYSLSPKEMVHLKLVHQTKLEWHESFE